MRICFVLSHFFPENNALTNRVEVLLPLLSIDHEVAVVYLLEPGKSFDESATRQMFPSSNLTLYPVRAILYDKDHLSWRFIGETANNIRLWLAARRVPAEIFWVSVPQLMLLPVSALFVPYVKARRILELRDLTWCYMDFGNQLFGKLIRKLVDQLARFSIRRFDEVVTCTAAQADYIEKYARMPAKVVRNGISRRKFSEIIALDGFNQKRRPFTVAYIGTLGHSQNIITLAHAAKLLRNDADLHFLIVGEGRGLKSIEAFVQVYRLTNVEITGKLPWNETLQCYRRANTLYTQLTRGVALRTAEPTKLFEYFSSGLPVIYGGSGLGRELSSRFEHAYLVESDDAKGLAKTILKIKDSNLSVSINNRALIEKEFIREDIFRIFLQGSGLDNSSGSTRATVTLPGC